MNMAKYCKSKGMSLQQYKQFKQNIKNTANAIRSTITDTKGMYYPINDLLTYSPQSEVQPFIIQELKKLGFEFIENNSLWRY